MAILTRLSLYGGPGKAYPVFLPKAGPPGSCDLTEVLAAIAAVQDTVDSLELQVAAVTLSLNGLSTDSGGHDLLLKYVKAILHDNKRLLDLVESMKGHPNGSPRSNPHQKENRDPRGGIRG